MVVLPDADVDMAADAAVSAGYGSSGERCMAIATSSPSATRPTRSSRRSRRRPAEVKVGPGRTDPGGRDGARSSRVEHRDKVASYSDSGRPRARRGSSRTAATASALDAGPTAGFFLGVSLDQTT
jgi:malonate-semialdehyde dehydrogenase (acetylating)/methylmalonate-semialdehyde dehydrogenase